MTSWVSQYQKGKTNLDLLEQEIESGSGISWAICKSAPCTKQSCQHLTRKKNHQQLAGNPANRQTKKTDKFQASHNLLLRTCKTI